MKRQNLPASKAITALLRRNPLRSDAHRWLADNYTQIKRTFVGERIPWHELEKEAATLGLKDGNGNPPTANTLRQNFYRISKKQQKTEAAQAARKAEPQPSARPGPPPVARPPKVESWRRPESRPPTASTEQPISTEERLLRRIRARL